jgi:hypothetical protein
MDGTRYVLDATDTYNYCIDGNSTFIRFVNFEFYDAVSHGAYIGTAGSDHWVFINCISHSHGGSGFYAGNSGGAKLIRCRSYNNSWTGFDGWDTNSIFLWSAAENCADEGFMGYEDSLRFIGCVAHNCAGGSTGDCGLPLRGRNVVFNSIADGCTEGGTIYGGNNTNVPIWIGVRITNNASGLNIRSDTGPPLLFGWCLFDGNTTDIANDGSNLFTGIPDGSDTDTNEYDPDSAKSPSDGYNDRANDDLNLREDYTYNGESDDAIEMGLGS